MASRIVLHVGTMKSGTTYLQHALAALDQQLSASDWLYPPTWLPGEVPNHQAAFYHLLGSAIPWVREETDQTLWADQADAMLRAQRAWPGPVLLSSEALASLDPEGVRKCLDLFNGTPVEVVITARDLGRIIPSWWQQSVRAGSVAGLDQLLGWLAAAWDDPSVANPTAATFWRSHRLAHVAGRWVDEVGAPAVRVVTLPRSGSRELFGRFHAGVGLPAEVPTAPPPLNLGQSNVGATAPEAAVLLSFVRRLVEEGVDQKERAARVRELLEKSLADRPDRGAPVRLPSDWLPEVSRWAEQDLAELRAQGVKVIGDPADLLVDPAEHASAAEAVEVEQVAAAAAAIAAHATKPTPPPRLAQVSSSRPVSRARQVAGRVRRAVTRRVRSLSG